MQENSFLPDIGMTPKAFWDLVKKEAEEHDMDEVLAYMQLMKEKAGEDQNQTYTRHLEQSRKRARTVSRR